MKLTQAIKDATYETASLKNIEIRPHLFRLTAQGVEYFPAPFWDLAIKQNQAYNHHQFRFHGFSEVVRHFRVDRVFAKVPARHTLTLVQVKDAWQWQLRNSLAEVIQTFADFRMVFAYFQVPWEAVPAYRAPAHFALALAGRLDGLTTDNANDTDTWGRTVLHALCQRYGAVNFTHQAELDRVIAHALELGADPARVDRFRLTALDYTQETPKPIFAFLAAKTVAQASLERADKRWDPQAILQEIEADELLAGFVPGIAKTAISANVNL